MYCYVQPLLIFLKGAPVRSRSLGLVRRTQSNRRRRLQVSGVGRLVSESQIWSDLVCSQLVLERPKLRLTPIEFDEDDVDWHLEYCFSVIGRWWSRICKWFWWVLEIFTNFCGLSKSPKDDTLESDSDLEPYVTSPFRSKVLLYTQIFDHEYQTVLKWFT